MERNDRPAECLGPDPVGCLAKLPAEDAKLHPPVIWSRGGVRIACWRDGEGVLWREIAAGTAAACGFAPAARTPRNLAGVSVSVSAFQHRAKATGEPAARFGREGVKGRQEDGSARTGAAKPSAGRASGPASPRALGGRRTGRGRATPGRLSRSPAERRGSATSARSLFQD